MPAHNDQLDAILQAYAAGDLSAADAAYDLHALALPGLESPSASEIILWSREAGYGIPTPDDETVRAEVAHYFRRR